MFLMNDGKIAVCAYSYKNMLLDLNYKTVIYITFKNYATSMDSHVIQFAMSDI
jgi:hypothetical protein